MFDVKWADLSDIQQGFLINLREVQERMPAHEYIPLSALKRSKDGTRKSLVSKNLITRDRGGYDKYKLTDYGRKILATEAPPADAPAVDGIPDVQCTCGYMASQHWADGSCPGDGYVGQGAPDDSGYSELLDELSGQIKGLERKLAAAQAALKPFAAIYERWTKRLLIDIYFPEWLEIHLTVQEQQGWYTRQWFEAAAKELEASGD